MESMSLSWCLEYKIMASASNCTLETICRKQKKGTLYYQVTARPTVKSVHVMRWMDVKTLSKICAGHMMDGHKHCQKCLQVMRWIDTLSKVFAGLVMRWINTNSVIVSNVSAGNEMDEHIVKCVCKS